MDESYIHYAMIALMLLALVGGLFNRWHSDKAIGPLDELPLLGPAHPGVRARAR